MILRTGLGVASALVSAGALGQRQATCEGADATWPRLIYSFGKKTYAFAPAPRENTDILDILAFLDW